MSLQPGLPTPDDVILRPALAGFVENLKMTWVILTLPSECQIWLAQGVGNTNSFIEIDSTPLKQSLWTRAVLLSAGVLNTTTSPLFGTE